MRALVLTLVAALAGCVTPASSFTCESDADCSGGRCEPATKFCSFVDAACTSGHRYGDAAGSLSNTCVGDDGNSVCGDGMVTGSEECDDGNSNANDLCVDCVIAKCGDGHVATGIEDCDDGNTVDGDGCNANCLICPANSATNPANNHCYFAVENSTTWDAAAADCANQGGYLATIDDDAENAFVQSLLMTSGEYWVGLHNSFQGTVRWQDEGLFQMGTSFDKWGMGEPSGLSNEDCVGMVQADGTWDQQLCGGPHPYVCEREPWVIDPITTHAYHRITGVAEQRYDMAVSKCQAIAAHLVTIADMTEQDFVHNLMPQANRFWIGLDDLSVEGTFAWVTGEPTDFFHWDTGEPDPVNFDVEDVVAMRDTGFWQTRDPSSGFSIDPYVCEMDP